MLLCLIASCLVLLDAVSTALIPDSKESALKINPLSSPARIATIEAELDDLRNGRILQDDELREIILDGIRLSPIDARYYSALGIVDASSGDQDQAKQLFAHSLELLPTEIQALTHQLVYSVQEERFTDAVDHLELIARRWPKYWSDIAPALPVLLANEAAYQDVTTRFSAEPNLRRMLVDILSRSPETLGLAMNVLLEWDHAGISGISGDLNTVTRRLVGSGRPSEAFLLFNLTRDPSAPNGYVYNGNFEVEPSGNPFDWSWQSQAGADIRIVNRKTIRDASTTAEPASETGKALSIRFLDNPVRFDNVRQLTRLVAGNYTLSVTYSVSNLRTPKVLNLGIRCRGKGGILASVQFDTEVDEPTTLETNFTVPPIDCDLQQITIYNRNLTDSWKNRYSGTLFLHSVAITRPGV